MTKFHELSGECEGKDSIPPQIFYRYEGVSYASASSGEYSGRDIFTTERIELREFVLIRETPKGYWIGIDKFTILNKWVSKDSVKRYAYPTKEEAFLNFEKRTRKHLEIMEHRVLFLKKILMLTERFQITKGRDLNDG